MREKWKLCVVSGSIMVFFVLGTLVLLNYTMASADNTGREFAVTQAVSGSSVSGSSVSGQAVSGESGAGSNVSEPAASGQEVSGEPVTGGSDLREDGKDDSKEPIELPSDASQEEQEGTMNTSSYSEDMDVRELPAVYGQVNPADPLGVQIVSCALGWQGVRYVYGGTDLPDQASAWTDGSVKDKKFEGKDLWGKAYGVDCSGLVMRAYEKFGIKLPRSVKEQAEKGKEVKLKDIEPGDIIFYGANNTTLTHCGIYAGDGQIIHVSAQTKVVTLDDMNYRRIAKVKRVVSE